MEKQTVIKTTETYDGDGKLVKKVVETTEAEYEPVVENKMNAL